MNYDLLTCLAWLLLGLGFLVCGIKAMDDNRNPLLHMAAILLTLILGLSSEQVGLVKGQKVGFEQGYKQGQVDAAEGKMDFEQVEIPGHKEWRQKPTTQPTEK